MKGSLMDLGVTKIGSSGPAQKGISPEMAMQDYLASVFESREAYKLGENGLIDFFNNKFVKPITLNARDGEFKGYFALSYDEMERKYYVGMASSEKLAIYNTQVALEQGLGRVPDNPPDQKELWWVYYARLTLTKKGEDLGQAIAKVTGEMRGKMEYRLIGERRKVRVEKVVTAAPILQGFVERIFEVRQYK